jgi:hypothetical protein
MEAFIPAPAIAPADICQAGHPARPPPLGLPSRHPGAVQGFLGTALGCHERHEVQKKATSVACCCRMWRLHCSRVGH